MRDSSRKTFLVAGVTPQELRERVARCVGQ